MTTPISVAIGSTVPLGTTIRRFGCNIAQDGNAITVKGKGYFLVTASITAAPDAVGTVTVAMSKGGVPVSGATASNSVSTAANSTALPITAIVRNACDCDSSALSFTLDGTASTVQNVAVTVVKI